MIWTLEALKNLARNETVPGIALRDALDGIDEAARERNNAYRERNQLVSLLSKMFPASLERHQPEDDDWEDDWRWVVIIDTPAGQASWHIHDGELPLFDHLQRNAGRTWDGHTVEEKYERISKLRFSH